MWITDLTLVIEWNIGVDQAPPLRGDTLRERKPLLNRRGFSCPLNRSNILPERLPGKLVNDMRKKLFSWGKTPIFVPRWMLSAKYAGFIVLGTLFLLWGNVTLSLATFDGYTTFWAIAVLISSVLCLPGSIDDRFEDLEKWSALVLSGFIASWAVAAGVVAVSMEELNRIPGAWAILLVGMFPAARAFGLLRVK